MVLHDVLVILWEVAIQGLHEIIFKQLHVFFFNHFDARIGLGCLLRRLFRWPLESNAKDTLDVFDVLKVCLQELGGVCSELSCIQLHLLLILFTDFSFRFGFPCFLCVQLQKGELLVEIDLPQQQVDPDLATFFQDHEVLQFGVLADGRLQLAEEIKFLVN